MPELDPNKMKSLRPRPAFFLEVVEPGSARFSQITASGQKRLWTLRDIRSLIGGERGMLPTHLGDEEIDLTPFSSYDQDSTLFVFGYRRIDPAKRAMDSAHAARRLLDEYTS